MRYSLFVEQQPFDGPARRASQRTVAINAFSDEVALKEAADYVEILFEGVTQIREIRAHVQRDDGSLVKEIVLVGDSRSPVAR